MTDREGSIRTQHLPDIRYNSRTFWEIVTLVYIIFRRCVWDPLNGKSTNGSEVINSESISNVLPKGTGGFHLIVSFTIAFTYGKFGRSSDFGSQSALTTRSISSCAFFCTEGLSIIARKNVRVVEMVFLTHASVGRSMFIIVDCDRPYLFQQDIARPPNI